MTPCDGPLPAGKRRHDMAHRVVTGRYGVKAGAAGMGNARIPAWAFCF